MKKVITTPSQQRALVGATIVALLFGAYFLRHYFILIVIAAILAFIFNPVYQRSLKKGRQPGRAAATTLLIAMLAIVIPISIVILLTVLQINVVLAHIPAAVSNIDVDSTRTQLINDINNFLANLHITFRITPEWINQALTKAVTALGNTLLGFFKSSITGFFSFITTLIIFTYVYISMLKNQAEIIKAFSLMNPLGTQASHLYIQKAGDMTKAMVRGQFIIAAAQGFTDAALIYLGGLHSGFFFFAMLLTVLSVIPLGGGIIAIPIGIIMALTGNIVGGVIVVGGHLLIVTNIDNILRPKLVPQSARLDPALLLLSVFAGIGLFGFLGIIVGPVIMIIIKTTIDVFLEVFKNVPRDDDQSEANEDDKQGVFDKVGKWSKGIAKRG